MISDGYIFLMSLMGQKATSPTNGLALLCLQERTSGMADAMSVIEPLPQESWHLDRIFRPLGVPFLKQGPLPHVIFGKHITPLGRKRFGSPTGSGNVLV
jgi:hypothetical protein